MSVESLQDAMIQEQLVPRGIRDPRVLDAMRRVPRPLFLPESVRSSAYDDRAVPIGFEQTISQPYMVAWMLQSLALKGNEKVLEIGAGSGYNAALLGELAREVHTLEIVPELGEEARRTLAGLGKTNVHVHIRDGSAGFPEEAPFDVILLTAVAPRVPPELLSQLSPNGRLLLPLAQPGEARHMLTLFRKNGDAVTRQDLGPCLFVPLRGAHGWTI